MNYSVEFGAIWTCGMFKSSEVVNLGLKIEEIIHK